MIIFCCSCEKDVRARLTNGGEIYPHRRDLKRLPFWRCDACGSFVGCHHKTKERTKPLGCMPTPEIRSARREIHSILDPLWQSGQIARGELYRRLRSVIGREYHTAEIRSIDEARVVLSAIRAIWLDIGGEPVQDPDGISVDFPDSATFVAIV